MGHLTQLRELYLSSNQLTSLPKSVQLLTQLRLLDLDTNQLATLPESLGHLKQLETLDLSENRLTSLAESLRELKLLRKLYLHGNPALGLPADIFGPPWMDVANGQQPADPQAILAFYFGRQQQTAKLYGAASPNVQSLHRASRTVITLSKKV